MRGERERVADRVRGVLGLAEQPPPGPSPGPALTGEQSRHRFRWEPTRRSVAAAALVLVVVVIATVWWVTSSRPTSVPVSVVPPVPVSANRSDTPAPDSSTAGASSTGDLGSPAQIVVDVAGRVEHPGIYRLPSDARVFDALQAAGGARPGVDTVAINLAAPLQDGEQVVVGVSGAPAGGVVGGATAPAGGAVAGSSSAPGPVDLNTATLEQLETLPRVGPVLGQRILDWRTQHGSFASVDQLDEVSGIGPATFAGLKDLVAV